MAIIIELRENRRDVRDVHDECAVDERELDCGSIGRGSLEAAPHHPVGHLAQGLAGPAALLVEESGHVGSEGQVVRMTTMVGHQ